MLVSDCKKCKTCIYRGTLESGYILACCYILHEKQSRGCEVGEDCNKYIKGDPSPLNRGIWLDGSQKLDNKSLEV